MVVLSWSCFLHFLLCAFAVAYSFPKPEGKEVSKHTTHMTGCEKSLYTTCVLKLATAENLINKCDASLLISCLNQHLSAELCRLEDKETVPTIETLLQEVSRRFKEKKTCGNAKFVQRVKEHFLVQSRSIETNIDDLSGSGDDMDDSEIGDDDSDSIAKDAGSETKHGEVPAKATDSVVDDVVQTWKERGRHLIGNKQWTRMAVFFDAPKESSSNAKSKPASRDPHANKQASYNSELKRVDKEWQRLKSEYESWFSRSKHNGLSGT